MPQERDGLFLSPEGIGEELAVVIHRLAQPRQHHDMGSGHRTHLTCIVATHAHRLLRPFACRIALQGFMLCPQGHQFVGQGVVHGLPDRRDLRRGHRLAPGAAG